MAAKRKRSLRGLGASAEEHTSRVESWSKEARRSFDDVIKKGLNVMDSTAFTLSQENKLPIVVFDMNKEGNLLKICEGKNIGTIVNV